MSGSRLCSLMKELGYEDADSMDPESFEWPFQYEEARPILEWICSSLRPSNIISTSEVSQYTVLLQEGKILEGEDLDFAYDSISAFTTKKDSDDAIFGDEESLKDIEDATLTYEKEALDLQEQIRQIQSQNDMFVKQTSALSQRRRALIALTSALNGQLTTIDDSLSARNIEMNGVLGRIASASEELAQYHSEDGIYLAYSNFQPFLHGDSTCIEELNQWFLKNLDTAPFRSVVEEGKSKCAWVSLSDISNVLEQDLEKSRRVSELQRLRSIFGISERKWVEAQAQNAKQQAVLMSLKSQLKPDESHIHRDLQSLRRKHSELDEELSNLHSKEEKLLSETIPGLCWELAQLQDTDILRGDYDLKIMRQECYINRQKAFINHLINHLARHQFLRMACQYERDAMLDAHSLLKVTESELRDYSSSTKSRVDRCLALIEDESDVQEQGAVDDRDTFMHGVRDLLNPRAGLSTYVSAPGLVQQISGLRSELAALQFELENSLPLDLNRYNHELHSLIENLHQLLYASSTTAQPILTPWPLMKELEELEKINATFFSAVDVINQDSKLMTQIMKKEGGLKSQVFGEFFCNPERLRNKVRDITALVRSGPTA